MRPIDADKLRHEIHCAYSDDLEILEHIDAQPTVQLEQDLHNTCADTISRHVAVDAVQAIGSLATLPDGDAVVRLSAVEYVLYHLPSAQSKRPQGHWIEDDDGYGETVYQCSECGDAFMMFDGTTPKNNNYFFCPHCGALMDGGEQNGDH